MSRFVGNMSGIDYENRSALLEILASKNQSHLEGDGAIIACGMTEFIPGQDEKVEDVFHRAVATMYVNKKQLKASR